MSYYRAWACVFNSNQTSLLLYYSLWSVIAFLHCYSLRHKTGHFFTEKYTPVVHIFPPLPPVTSPEIPDADSLLHADCNEQEVACEISRYFPPGFDLDAKSAYFIGSVVLEGGGISLTLVLQTLPPIGEGEEPAASPLLQSKLELPLTQSGTILTEGERVLL